VIVKSRPNKFTVICVVIECLSIVGMQASLAADASRDEAVAIGGVNVHITAPNVTTLQARYRGEMRSTVGDYVSSYTKEGRIYIRDGTLCVYSDILDDLPEKQILYKDGVCQRYFPFSAYGHQVVTLDGGSTDFARIWRPFLAHLYPAQEIAASKFGAPLDVSVRETGGKPTDITLNTDQAVERSRRTLSGRLEDWGPART